MQIRHPRYALTFGPSVFALGVQGVALSNLTAPSLSNQTQIASTYTETPLFKPHRESSATGFDDPSTTTTLQVTPNLGFAGAVPQDIGSIIQSILPILTMTSASVASPTVAESTVSSWLPTTLQEASVSKFLQLHSPDIGEAEGSYDHKVTGLSGKLILETTSPFYVTSPQITPSPVTMQNGLTILPVLVSSLETIADSAAATTTSYVVSYRYVIGSSTLLLNDPMTVNDIVILLSATPSGPTVLIAGDITTTLPAITRSVPVAQSPGLAAPLIVMTTVIEGTSKYVVSGQTLAPGQPVTVGGIAMSISTNSGSTILVVGNYTTTFPGTSATSTAIEWRPSTIVSAGSATFTNIATPAVTSKNTGNDKIRRLDGVLGMLLSVVALLAQI